MPAVLKMLSLHFRHDFRCLFLDKIVDTLGHPHRGFVVQDTTL
jgi:hypothetical protein